MWTVTVLILGQLESYTTKLASIFLGKKVDNRYFCVYQYALIATAEGPRPKHGMCLETGQVGRRRRDAQGSPCREEG